MIPGPSGPETDDAAVVTSRLTKAYGKNTALSEVSVVVPTARYVP
jgi:ABC-2 type transport system ATP-binding protein